VFFELLFSGIVSGIMIDKFAELRGKREEMNDDKKNKCYICGINRGEVRLWLFSFKRVVKSSTSI
jgi:hypothetical protein